MDQGKIAVKNISQQTVPSINELLHRMDLIGKNLQQLTGELAHNPSVVVRGKLPAIKGPGES